MAARYKVTFSGLNIFITQQQLIRHALPTQKKKKHTMPMIRDGIQCTFGSLKTRDQMDMLLLPQLN